MVMGRPKEYDRKQIAKNMVTWAKKDDSINLNAFCTTNDPMIPPSYISVWAKEDKNFSQAYELTKSFLGVRRELKLKNGELHVKAYDLNAAVYDYFLKEERRKEKEYESELKSKENEAPQNVVYKVNYSNDNPIGIPPKELPASNSPDSQ